MEENIEEKKGLKGTLDDVIKRLDDIEGNKKEKKNFFREVSSVGWILGFCLGALAFIIGWLYWDLVTGIIAGIVVLVLTLFIASLFDIFPPFMARRLGRKKKRKGYVVFMHIGLNKAVTFIKAPVIEGVAMLNGIPHVVNPKDILIWKNKIPIVIQASFAETPYSIENHYDKVRKENEGTEGWQFILNYMLAHEIKPKKSFGAVGWIVGTIIVIGLLYYAYTSGAFKI